MRVTRRWLCRLINATGKTVASIVVHRPNGTPGDRLGNSESLTTPLTLDPQTLPCLLLPAHDHPLSTTQSTTTNPQDPDHPCSSFCELVLTFFAFKGPDSAAHGGGFWAFPYEVALFSTQDAGAFFLAVFLYVKGYVDPGLVGAAETVGPESFLVLREGGVVDRSSGVDWFIRVQLWGLNGVAGITPQTRQAENPENNDVPAMVLPLHTTVTSPDILPISLPCPPTAPDPKSTSPHCTPQQMALDFQQHARTPNPSPNSVHAPGPNSAKFNPRCQ
ncbi:hypothetical protein C0992_005736 [Termitomyces sp. T32_za158]|nr:hypothetical protein C0992_005736 [Termitomyces sp. T32_za158]